MDCAQRAESTAKTSRDLGAVAEFRPDYPTGAGGYCRALGCGSWIGACVAGITKPKQGAISFAAVGLGAFSGGVPRLQPSFLFFGLGATSCSTSWGALQDFPSSFWKQRLGTISTPDFDSVS